jgi:hypothetical protein
MDVMCPSSTVTRGCSRISFPRKSRRAVIVLVISVLPLRKDIATGGTSKRLSPPRSDLGGEKMENPGN